jgi:hypothetical protein
LEQASSFVYQTRKGARLCIVDYSFVLEDFENRRKTGGNVPQLRIKPDKDSELWGFDEVYSATDETPMTIRVSRDPNECDKFYFDLNPVAACVHTRIELSRENLKTLLGEWIKML